MPLRPMTVSPTVSHPNELLVETDDNTHAQFDGEAKLLTKPYKYWGLCRTVGSSADAVRGNRARFDGATPRFRKAVLYEDDRC
jgi:hypothetical protein